MIGIGTGDGEKTFHHIHPAHRIPGRCGFATLGELTNADVQIRFIAKEIAIKRNNDLRLVDAMICLYGTCSTRYRSRGGIRGGKANRFKFSPFGLRQLGDHLVHQATAGR